MIELLENKHSIALLLDTSARGHKDGHMPPAPTGHAPFRTNNRLKLADVFVRLVP
jgi:hypothetical protein